MRVVLLLGCGVCSGAVVVGHSRGSYGTYSFDDHNRSVIGTSILDIGCLSLEGGAINFFQGCKNKNTYYVSLKDKDALFLRF